MAMLLRLLILSTIQVVLMSAVGLGPDDLAAQVSDLCIVPVYLFDEFTESKVGLISTLLYFG